MFVIAGQTLDAFGTPVPDAVVTVHRRSDGGILGTMLSASDGKFVFTGLPDGEEVYVSITLPGREPQIFDQVDPVTEITLTADNRFVVNICDPLGTVGPAIVEGDMTGHTILWEQIDGPPVTLNDANTLAPTYDNTPVGQTRVFRLTLDAGTCLETIAEYTVSGRPQSNDSRVAGLNTVGFHYYQPQTGPRSSKSRDTTNYRLVPRGWTPGAGDYVTGSDCPVTQFWVQFDPPADISALVQYDIQQWIAGEFQTIAVLPANGLTVVDAVPGETYRVCALHRITDSTVFPQYSKPFVGKTKDGVAAGLSIDERINTARGRINNFTVNIPTRIVKTPESTHERLNTAEGRVDGFKEFVLLNKGLDGSVFSTDDRVAGLNSAGTRSFSIVRNEGTSIGS